MANYKNSTIERLKATEEAEAIMSEAAEKATAKLEAAGFGPDDEESAHPCSMCSCPEFKPSWSNPYQCRHPGCRHGWPRHLLQ